MSELKAFDVVLGQYAEDGYTCIVAIDADQNPRELDEKVYLKSEADKVIADKDREIAYAQSIVLKDIKLIRHHKYRRCLDKAELCERKRIDAANYRIPRKKWEFYEKWRNRYLELARNLKT